MKAAFLCLCLCSIPWQARAGDPLQLGLPRKPLLGIPGVESTHCKDLPGIVERGTLRILTTCSLTNYFILDGTEHGFEYQLLRKYVDSLSKEHPRSKVGVTAQFIPLPPDQLVPALLEGKGDIVANTLHIVDGCTQGTRYTEPYLKGVQELLVSHSSQGAIGSFREMSGKRVYVPGKAGCRIPLTRISQDLSEQGLEPLDIRVVDSCLTVEDVLELVNSGVFPLTLAERYRADLMTRLLPELAVSTDIAVADDVQIGLLVRQGNEKLRKSLNSFLRKHRKGTKLGNIYFRRYIENTPCIEACAEDGLKRFGGHAHLFQEYAAKYGIDWLLIAAQAYQESRLDHNRVSEDGAFGIMQIMPALTRDERIGLQGLDKLENNIHAGVKYLHVLLTRYFQDSGISAEERIRFALAAYNAGPKAIQRARRQAEEGGLDPDIWYGNVEQAVLQSIGREPVNYVRQINRRYITYSLAMATLEMRQMAKQQIKSRLDTATVE